MCAKHSTRMFRNGTLETTNTPPGESYAWLMEFLNAGVFPKEECVVWPFPLSSKGYAHFKHEGVKKYGHQVACEFYRGEKPIEAQLVRHLCHKGHLGCVNPEHLAWGTYSENTFDYLNATGATRGEKSGMSKLTEEQVREIYRRLSNGEQQKVVALDYGVDKSSIGSIWRGHTWSHVTKIERKPVKKRGGG